MDHRYGIHTVYKIQYQSEIVRRIKGHSSTKLFERIPDMRRWHWARVNSCVTPGDLAEEQILRVFGPPLRAQDLR